MTKPPVRSTRRKSCASSNKKAKLASTAPDDEIPVPAYFRQARFLYESGLSPKKQVSIVRKLPLPHKQRAQKPRLKPTLPIHSLVPCVPYKVKQKQRRRRLNRSVKCYPRMSSSTTEKKRCRRSSKPKPGIIDNLLRSQSKWSSHKRTGRLGRTAGVSLRRLAGSAGGSS